MAQHPYFIENQSGASFRTDLNNALEAIVTNNSGPTQPIERFAHQWWFDTSTNELKIRNAANNAWVSVARKIGNSWTVLASQVRSTGDVIGHFSSDIKNKENIKEIPNALEKVLAISGKTFDWKDDYIKKQGGEDGYFINKKDFGVIAQDVEKVFPIAVKNRKEKDELAVDYVKLCALAFAAIKELKQELDELRGEK